MWLFKQALVILCNVRKPKMNSPKLFCNLESLSFRQIAFGKFFKSRKQFQILVRSTNNFHENRKQFTIQGSFQNSENSLKSRKIFCHVTLAPVVELCYDTAHCVALGCSRSTWSHHANGLNCTTCIVMFCLKC